MAVVKSKKIPWNEDTRTCPAHGCRNDMLPMTATCHCEACDKWVCRECRPWTNRASETKCYACHHKAWHEAGPGKEIENDG